MLHEIKNVAFVYLDDTTFELPPFGYVGDRQIIWKKKKKRSYMPTLNPFGACPALDCIC